MANAKTNWWKWAVIIAILIFVFWVGCGVGRGGFGCTPHRDTASVKIDTTINNGKDSVIRVPVPYKVDSLIYVPGKPKKVYLPGDTITETSYEYALPTDTAQIISNYFSTSYYNDTVRFKRGWVAITDTISMNAIQGRKIVSSISDTTIKETVVLTQPKKRIVYFTLSAMGNKNDPVYAIGGGLAIKSRNDKMYGLEWKQARNNIWYVEGRIGIPIRLTKKNNR